ncbi:MAG TPA: hypothetical protein VGQ44_20280 [Gemmatimonadaceae bacterium]|jgi:hypothetical protein|nr:hypothetical protein [Gemmatimonadaceae bacterium]
MSAELLGQITALVTVLGVLSTVAGVVLGLRIYRRQANAQAFLTYTERYEQIMSSYPPDARLARLDSDRVLPPKSPELTLSVLRYLNLCSEELYLFRYGHLDKKLWAIWQDELTRMLRTPLVRREWVDLRREFESYPEFLQFVERAQGSVALAGRAVAGFSDAIESPPAATRIPSVHS